MTHVLQKGGWCWFYSVYVGWGWAGCRMIDNGEISKCNLQSRLEIILPLETCSSYSGWKQKKRACFSFGSLVQKMCPRKMRQNWAFEVNGKIQEAFAGDFLWPKSLLHLVLPSQEVPLEPPSSPLQHWSLNNLGSSFLGNVRNYIQGFKDTFQMMIYARSFTTSPSPAIILPESI